jgi:uncharacterized protein YlxW (UPF0749 family)
LTRSWKGIAHTVSLLAVGLTLGLLLSASLRVPARSIAPTTNEATLGLRNVSPESVRIGSSIERLEAEQQALKSTLAEQRGELAQRQQSAAAHAEQLTALQAEVQKQRLLAGLTPVQGTGVVITLDDSSVRSLPDDNANRYLIHDYDLRDIVGVLWMAGSEAIAINEERLVGNSSIYCVGSTVMVNNTRLSPPYTIRAIGDPRLQQDYLRNPSYLQDLRDRQRLYGLQVEVQGTARVLLPAHTGGFLIQYAQPGE